MENEYILADPVYELEVGTDEDNIKMEDLTEVYCVAYKVKSRIPNTYDKEHYTFTSQFDQAFKRFKLLPHRYATLIRILTNKKDLIKLAEEGTAQKYDNLDEEEVNEIFKNLKYQDIYGGAISEYHSLNKLTRTDE